MDNDSNNNNDKSENKSEDSRANMFEKMKNMIDLLNKEDEELIKLENDENFNKEIEIFRNKFVTKLDTKNGSIKNIMSYLENITFSMPEEDMSEYVKEHLPKMKEFIEKKSDKDKLFDSEYKKEEEELKKKMELLVKAASVLTKEMNDLKDKKKNDVIDGKSSFNDFQEMISNNLTDLDKSEKDNQRLSFQKSRELTDKILANLESIIAENSKNSENTDSENSDNRPWRDTWRPSIRRSKD